MTSTRYTYDFVADHGLPTIRAIDRWRRDFDTESFIVETPLMWLDDRITELQRVGKKILA